MYTAPPSLTTRAGGAMQYFWKIYYTKVKLYVLFSHPIGYVQIFLYDGKCLNFTTPSEIICTHSILLHVQVCGGVFLESSLYLVKLYVYRTPPHLLHMCVCVRAPTCEDFIVSQISLYISILRQNLQNLDYF